MRYFYSRYWGILALKNPETFTEPQDCETIKGFGYSGVALNDVHKENISNVGPLPHGSYTITKVYDDAARGRHTCVLTPASTNKMYGRSGFLIHGDTPSESHNASDGCIIMPLWIRTQFKVEDEIEVL